jgi:calcium-dependent protein kinase
MACVWNTVRNACLLRPPQGEFNQEEAQQTRTKVVQESKPKKSSKYPTIALGDDDRPKVSLEKIRRRSSNAAIASARYHHHSLHEDYEVLPDKVLGEGCSGKVVVARSRASGRKFALKRINKSEVAPKVLQQLVAEVEIFLTLDHPHVARLNDVYDTDKEIALLTECLEGGELYGRLAELKTFPEPLAAETTRQMLRAVGYLHSHNIVHRDLKLENFLYEDTSENAPVKVIDFGFAKVWDSSKPMQASCGSIAYVSPDVLHGRGYSNKCDLWSLGVIVFMLLAGYPPFHGSDYEMKNAILAAKVDWKHRRRWAKVSNAAIDFVKGLLVGDPKKRLDAQAAMNHPWLVSAASSINKPVLPAAALRSIGSYADAPPLRRAVLQLVSRDLAPEDVAELRVAFLQVAGDDEGTVTFSELKSAIRGDEPPCQGDKDKDPKTPARKLRRAKTEQLKELFHMMDANGDEQVYYSDFLAAAMDQKLNEEHIWTAFCRLDADHSGTISIEDVQHVIGSTFEGEDTRQILDDAEFTPTANGEIGFDSFRKALTTRSFL